MQPEALKEITNSIGIRMALIPAGDFMMGAPEDENDFSAHLVSIFREFTFPRQVTGSACNWAGSRVGCAGRTGNLFRLN
jgi:hypothetical protein